REWAVRPSLDPTRAKTDSPSPPEAQRGLHRAERLNAECDVLVQRHAELLGALAHLVAVHAAGECLILELLLDRRHLEIREALGRAHQRACDEEAAQLVDRKERL